MKQAHDRFRVPFPAKAFLSYVAVVAAGAIPTFIYLGTSFEEELRVAEAHQMSRRAALLAGQMRGTDRAGRLEKVRAFAAATPERVTYLSRQGLVVFDSSPPALPAEGPDTGPEILRALARLPPHRTLTRGVPGVGFSIRSSSSSGEEELYVATAVDKLDDVPADERTAEVIRLSTPLHRVHRLAEKILLVFRNAQAGALSVALLLSLIAAYVFMRPLQRLVRAADALAGGDFTASTRWRGADEIGDVGNALNELAGQLRRRLATSHETEAVLVQAASLLPCPAVLLGPDSELIAVNGAFRRAVENDERNAEEVVSRIVGSKKFAQTRERAAGGVGPVELKWARRKIGVPMQVSELQRTGSAPFVLITSVDPEVRTVLPTAADIRVKTSASVLEAALARCSDEVRARVAFEAADEAAPLKIVDAQRRLELAIAVLAESIPVSVEGPVAFDLVENGVEVRLRVASTVPASAHAVVRSLTEAIGCSTHAGDDEFVLSMVKA